MDDSQIDGRRDQLDQLEKQLEVVERQAQAAKVPGFPVDDPPDKLEPLRGSIVADILNKTEDLYSQNRYQTSRNGCKFASCIKPGIDWSNDLDRRAKRSATGDPGPHDSGVPGIVAGDDNCYVLFRELFDLVIEKFHDFPVKAAHKTFLDDSLIHDTGGIDGRGRYVTALRMETRRNLKGISMGPAADTGDRREVEAAVAAALSALAGVDKGKYYSLPDSWSYGAMQGGMDEEQQEHIRSRDAMMYVPDSTILIAGGYDEDWPDARGVYLSDDDRLQVRLNQEDHARFISTGPSADAKQVFTRLYGGIAATEQLLVDDGYELSHDPRLGYLTTDPAHLGTGLHIEVTMRLPLLTARKDFDGIVEMIRLQYQYHEQDPAQRVEVRLEDEATWPIIILSNPVVLGRTEVEITNLVTDGMDRLVGLEDALQTSKGFTYNTIMREIRVSHEQGTNMVYFDANAAVYKDECPAVLPDLSGHNNMLAICMTQDPGLFDFRGLTTSLGVHFARCIRPGLNKYGTDQMLGLVGGDEESYLLFDRAFNAVIDMTRRLPWPLDARHITNLDKMDYTFKLRETELDEDYVVSVRVRGARNLRGFRLPVAVTTDERRHLEEIVVRALLSLTEDQHKGDYHPLSGSDSYEPKAGGMSEESEEAMRSTHMLFGEPSAPDMMVSERKPAMDMIASGYHVDWPDARGVFCNNEKDFFVWCNEKDHMRVFTMEMGGDVQETFLRYCAAIHAVEDRLKNAGQEFMHNDRLGYVTSSPADLGTGLRVSVMVNLPLLSVRDDFAQLLLHLMLDFNPVTSHRGMFQVFNHEKLGRTEVELCNVVIDGVDTLIKMEKLLDEDQEIVSEAYAIKSAYERGDMYPPIPPFPDEVCPESIPDVVDHHTLLGRVLKMNPGNYHRYKHEHSPGGVPFARCIKSGIDNKGQAGTKACGLYAGDEDCYDTFRAVFDGVIEMRHDMSGYHRTMVHIRNTESEEIRNVDLDPEKRFIFSISMRTARNIRGFQLPPSCIKKERRQIEKHVVEALFKVGLMDENMVGDYFPLENSYSWKEKPGGITEEEADTLRKNHILFEEPNSPLLVSGGMHRDWPDARGVFCNAEQNFFGWINQEDHVRFITNEMSSDMKAIFVRLYSTVDKVEEALKESEHEFMCTDRLGYISTCPSNLGTGLRIGVMMKLPKLSKRDDFKSIIEMLKLHVRAGSGDGVVEISNADRLGRTEVELINLVIHGLEKIIAMEDALQKNVLTACTTIIREIRAAHESDGMYDSSYFPGDICPIVLPDLSLHHNIFAQVLLSMPDLYEQHRMLATPGGVSFGRCIKVGMIDHGTDRSAGLVAGDEQSYDFFAPLFHPVIEILHAPYRLLPDYMSDMHRTNLDPSSLFSVRVDAHAKHIISTRVRGARNIRGFRLPPSCTKEEREQVETVVVQALLSLQDAQHRGDYYPLNGSNSYDSKRGGMTHEHEADMQLSHMLFFEPATPDLIVSGYHRDWPDARGLFCNDAKDFFVWINQKDHIRVCTLEMGGDVQHAFLRYCTAMEKVQEALLKVGRQEFMHSDRLGYITTCPSNLGTGLRLSVMIRLPLLSGRSDYLSVIAMLRLHSRAGSGDGVVEISNFDRLGRTEVELTNCVIYGADQLVWMERQLESGGDIEQRVELLGREREQTMANFTYVASSHHANLTKGDAAKFQHGSTFENGKVGAVQPLHGMELPEMHGPPGHYATGASSPVQSSAACTIL